MLDLDADFFAFVGEEIIDLRHDAVRNNAKIGIGSRSGPDCGLGENGGLDRTPAHFGLDRFSAFEGDGWLDRQLQVVGGAFFRVFMAKLARDVVLLELDGRRRLGCCIGDCRAVELDCRAALRIPPGPTDLAAQKTCRNLGFEPSLNNGTSDRRARCGLGKRFTDLDLASFAVLFLFRHASGKLWADAGILRQGRTRHEQAGRNT